MYTPKVFGETRPARLIRMLDSQGLASLVHADECGISITHVPMFRASRAPPEQFDQLRGEIFVAHMARVNPLAKKIGTTFDLTAAFLGPESYVSGSWYRASPALPTWNYMAIHLHGTARIFDEPDRLLKILDRTAEIYEPHVAGNWYRGNVEQPLVERLLGGIVGIELTVKSVEATFKLSQNQSSDEVRRLIGHLRAQGNARCDTLADAMHECLLEKDGVD